MITEHRRNIEGTETHRNAAFHLRPESVTAFWSHNPFPRSYSTRPKRNHGGCREFPHSGPCFFGVFHMNGWWDSKPNFPPSYPCRPVSNVSLSDQCPGNDQPGRRGFLRAPGKQRWTRCGHRSVLRLQPWADFQGDPWFIHDLSMINQWWIYDSSELHVINSSVIHQWIDLALKMVYPESQVNGFIIFNHPISPKRGICGGI